MQQRTRFVLVLAGGSGRRFWPLSRDARPKQLLPLFDGRSLLEMTLQRIEGMVAPENVLVLTNPLQEPGVREVCAGLLPAENILSEPERRDTGPAIALGAGWVAARDPEGVMAVLPSDHMIRDEAGFRATLEAAFGAAAVLEGLVTIGIEPTWPSPGFGYIEVGEKVDGVTGAGGHVVRRVRSFREKPAPDVAATFLERGGFFWNAGMFAWSLPTVRRELAAHAPDLAAYVDVVAAHTGAGALPAAHAARFAELGPRSIDYALLEKSGQTYTLPASFDWDDMGSWPALGGVLPADTEGNRSNYPVITGKASSNLVFHTGTKQVALLGVRDLIVVETADAILVARREDAEEVKRLCNQVPPELL